MTARARRRCGTLSRAPTTAAPEGDPNEHSAEPWRRRDAAGPERPPEPVRDAAATSLDATPAPAPERPGSPDHADPRRSGAGRRPVRPSGCTRCPAAVRRAAGRVRDAAVRPAGPARSAAVRRTRLLPHAGSRRTQQGHGDHRPDHVDPRLHLHRCAGRNSPRDRGARPEQGRPQPRQGARHCRDHHQRDQPDQRGDRRLLRSTTTPRTSRTSTTSRRVSASPPTASPTSPRRGSPRSSRLAARPGTTARFCPRRH